MKPLTSVDSSRADLPYAIAISGKVIFGSDFRGPRLAGPSRLYCARLAPL